MRPELVFFIAFRIIVTQIGSIFGEKFKFEILFLLYFYLIMKKNHTKREQNHAKYTVFTQNFNPR